MKNSLNIKKVAWKEAKKSLQKLDPKLTRIIDELSPGNEFPLYQATYSFGSQVLKNGQFYLPTQQASVISLNHHSVEKEIQDDLNYNSPTPPVFIALKNSLELFVTLQERVIPYRLISPGNMGGIWKVLDKRCHSRTAYVPYTIWDMTSGARSIFMLPKIAEKSGHTRLQKAFDFTIDKPDDLRDHWKIFSAIAANEHFGEKWECDVLLFSKKWFSCLEDPAWKNFTLHLWEAHWKNTEYWRSQYAWDLTFSRIHTARNMTPNPYHADIVKHLLAVSAGALPGFAPSVDDALGPMKTLQKIYSEVYRLNHWAPIVIQPHLYNMYFPSRPVYYSLQYPSAIELSPSSNKRASVIEDTYMVCALLEKYRQDLASGSFNIDSTILHDITRLIKYEFFHNDAQGYSKVKDNKLIPKSDHTFLSPLFPDRAFPSNSAFFKGCVRMASL